MIDFLLRFGLTWLSGALFVLAACRYSFMVGRRVGLKHARSEYYAEKYIPKHFDCRCDDPWSKANAGAI